MRRRRVAYIVASSCALVVTLGSCSLNQTVRDLEGVPLQTPERVELFANVDKFPNVVALCIHGAGFATTTRDNSAAAVRRVEVWDAPNGWCGSGKPR